MYQCGVCNHKQTQVYCEECGCELERQRPRDVKRFYRVTYHTGFGGIRIQSVRTPSPVGKGIRNYNSITHPKWVNHLIMDVFRDMEPAHTFLYEDSLMLVYIANKENPDADL